MTRPGGWNSPYPDFLGVGAQKSGTTWLSHNLRLHPQIRIPEIKEVHYFDDRINDPENAVSRLSSKLFGRGVLDRRWRRIVKTQAPRHLKGFSAKELLWDLRYFLGAPNDEWYASLFEKEEGTVTGEITPDYSVLEPDTIARVHELMPQAKIIFTMRNPVERAWSQATQRYLRSIRQNDKDSVQEARLRRHFDSERSRLRTSYLQTLENWGAFYPEDRIFVCFLEDVHFFPEELLRDLYAFLGVDSSFVPAGLDQRIHFRSTGQAPARPLVYLARTYREEISRLSERFDGYATFWLFCAERLADYPPAEEQVPYPLWDSLLWNEWKGSREIRMQSGTLSSIQVAT